MGVLIVNRHQAIAPSRGGAATTKPSVDEPRPADAHHNNWLLGVFSGFRTGDNDRLVTRDELRRHDHADSAWILVGDAIYDATSYVRSHPGGMAVILKKAGGKADCTEDLRFHSGHAQRTWKKHRVGTLIRDPRVDD